MNLDLVKYTWNNIRHRKIRSWLTVVSILIGIMAIFALVSFGQGLQGYVNDAFAKMGTDKIIIQPKGFAPPGSNPFTLTQSDLDYIRKIGGVAEAEAIVGDTVEVRIDPAKKGKFVSMVGFDPSSRLITDTLTLDIIEGSELSPNDNYKVILGNSYLKEKKVFEKPLRKGSKIYIRGFQFEVKGFYQEVGNPSDDSMIAANLNVAEEVLNKTNQYQQIILRVQQGEDVNAIAQKIQDKLAKRKNQKAGQETFNVQTFQQLMETFSMILNIINGVLLLIALVSVIVAGVNIMNSMFTAVLERTKEIGIMKAIGAKRSSILSIFLIESASLGFVGGAIGIGLGFGVAKIGESIALAYGLTMLRPAFPWWLILGCLAFATVVAGLAGLTPAIRAARQKPVDALRYE